MSTLNAIQPFLILPVIYLTRGIDFNEGSRMLYLRAAFVAVHLAVMGVMMLLRQRIEASGKATQITVKAAKSAWAPSEEPEERKMSEKDYDMEQWNTLFKGTVTQLLILGAIHWKWEVTVPLLSQVLMSPLKLYGSELVQAYYMGATVTRPFPVPKSPFADMLGGLQGDDKPKKKDKKASKAVPENATVAAPPARSSTVEQRKPDTRPIDDID